MFGTDFQGILWWAGIKKEMAKAIFEIAPGVGFLIGEIPDLDKIKNQEKVFGFKYHIISDEDRA